MVWETLGQLGPLAEMLTERLSLLDRTSPHRSFDIAHLSFSKVHGYRLYRDSADRLRALDDQLTAAFRNEIL
jgi:hypothetical protein